MKVLITGGKSARAFKLLRAFKEEEVVVADYGEMPQMPAASFQFLSMGEHNPDTVAHSLLTFCLDNTINALLPVYDFEIEAVGKSSVLFEEFGIRVLEAANLADNNPDHGI